ncbi:hypothetical protein RND71_029203 [Anisodus tanguticus]|uniref:Transmembrane protein n=1 Tax=Anisodus tanguticus TaxID=243964 RepID=A0AAE1RE18_9SOLA|nr:hypothetical protein RND71_029203 [Anisodus tanguticus]
MANNFISRSSSLIAVVMFVMIIPNVGVIPCTAAGFNHRGILIQKPKRPPCLCCQSTAPPPPCCYCACFVTQIS